ncbi:Transcriptional regulator PadR-like family protein [Blastococcus sp. DSM 46786]|uniref:PadR family transcriptional regulator n=1 Tax=Blastococcus sp. DSM 46786 TaxID=1798227 RepID=UPI0008AFF388|nr:PadR family transcriptional regulator [Blastococcus sp. DSM 46786]SEK30388.1 Transcriptional regulator PadR-like family protein [Blastococcus sp. DSM 46786]
MTARPLTEPAFLVLAALADRPRHGYGVIGEVEELSGGRVRLRVGTLYGVLDRLVAEGAIEPEREEVHAGRVRRYYRLTGAGRQVLEAEVARLEANARAVRGRLAVRPA